jgi:hypothetical protein
MKFLLKLIEIHLHTHQVRQTILCVTNIDLQSIRFLKSKKEVGKSLQHFKSFQKEINNTGTYISKFKASRAEITNYYYKTQRNHSAKAL